MAAGLKVLNRWLK